MATNNAVNTGLSGVTGSGNFVGANTPTLITPVIGAATGTSLAFSPTTGGIIGTTAADNAGSGKVGELITSNIALASGVSLTNNTAANVTSISLTAGDWDVFGNATVSATAISSGWLAWTSTTSATSPDASKYAGLTLTPSVTSQTTAISCPYLRVNVSGTTTVYLSCLAQFSTGTATGSGSIFARRVR